MIERLSLFVPGLLAPVRAGESRHPVHDVDRMALRTLLASSQQRQLANCTQTYTRLRGFSPWQDAAAVAKALALPPATAWLFAAPVLLRPDHAGIYLLGSRPLQLSPTDAERYCEELNRWLQQDAMRLYPVSPSCWLLALPETTGLQWHPLVDAIGKDLRHIWPEGDGSIRWQSRLTEWQMVLNQSAHNQQRQQQGLPPVHSLWLWGTESVSPVNVEPADPLTFFSTGQSAMSEQMINRDTAHSLQTVLATPTQHVVVLDDRLADAFMHGDVIGYQQAYAQFVADTLVPLHASFRRGDIAQLNVYPDDGHAYIATHKQRWQFWRRAPLPAVLREEGRK